MLKPSSSKSASAPRVKDEEPCPQPFSEAIRQVRETGHSVAGTELARAFGAEPDSGKLGESLVRCLSSSGAPVLPPSRHLPPMP